jgi:hypothetical protein
MSRGRITAYLRYQLFDFLLYRAALPTVAVVLFAWMMLPSYHRTAAVRPEFGVQMAETIYRNLAGVFITLGAFLGVARIVTDDRSNGYYRFLFSKPVSITRFYVQQWLLSGLGYVVIVGVLAYWLQTNMGQDIPVKGVMMVMALTWVLVGGVGFLLSVLSNADAAILVFVYIVSTVMHGVKAMPDTPMGPVLRQLTRVTLPTQKLDFVKDHLYNGLGVSWPHAWYVIAYGGAAFVAAVIILRRTSFAR